MSANRILSGLSTLTLLMLSGLAAWAQDHELRGMQLFEEADVRPYGNWAQPKEGFFLTFDGIYWHISPPNHTSIGYPGLTPTVFYGPNPEDSITEENTLDTSRMRAKWKQGDRIEFGYVDGHHGVMVTTLDICRQTFRWGGSNVFVVFNDPVNEEQGTTLLEGVLGTITDPTTGVVTYIIDELPTNFTSVKVQNRFKIQGVEALYIYRPHQLHFGATVECFLGGRYLSLDDDFSVTALGGNLADSAWDTRAQNKIGGPEVGLRIYKPIGRFALSGEGRFMAGANAQSIRQDGTLASKLFAGRSTRLTDGLPLLMNATGFSHSANFTEFSPLVEVRAEAHCQITNLISVKAGWTAIWMNGVARACDMIDYTVPQMGITTINGGNRQDLFMQGFNIGLEINR